MGDAPVRPEFLGGGVKRPAPADISHSAQRRKVRAALSRTKASASASTDNDAGSKTTIKASSSMDDSTDASTAANTSIATATALALPERVDVADDEHNALPLTLLRALRHMKAHIVPFDHCGSSGSAANQQHRAAAGTGSASDSHANVALAGFSRTEVALAQASAYCSRHSVCLRARGPVRNVGAGAGAGGHRRQRGGARGRGRGRGQGSALQQYGDSSARRKLQAQCWAAVVNACTDAVSDIPTAGSSAAAASDTDAALSAGASAGVDVIAGTAGTETEGRDVDKSDISKLTANVARKVTKHALSLLEEKQQKQCAADVALLPPLRWLAEVRELTCKHHLSQIHSEAQADTATPVHAGISVPRRRSRFVAFCRGQLRPTTNTTAAAATSTACSNTTCNTSTEGVAANSSQLFILPPFPAVGALSGSGGPHKVSSAEDAIGATAEALWRWLSALADQAAEEVAVAHATIGEAGGGDDGHEAGGSDPEAKALASHHPAPAAAAPMADDTAADKSLLAPPTNREAAAAKMRKAAQVFGSATTTQPKLYLAPLTTVGNLPFRRICRRLGADITCGEMAIADNLLRGQQSELARLRRHRVDEATAFGVQIAGARPEVLARACELIERTCNVDFIDLNAGCPLDSVCNIGGGSGSSGGGGINGGAGLLRRPPQLHACLYAMSSVLEHTPITLKTRTGWKDDHPNSHKVLPCMRCGLCPLAATRGADVGTGTGALSAWNVAARGWQTAAAPTLSTSGLLAAVTLHGRSRQQRYTRAADWSFINRCRGFICASCGASAGAGDRSASASLGFDASPAVTTAAVAPHQSGPAFFGNGDVYSWEDVKDALEAPLAAADSEIGAGACDADALERAHMTGVMIGRGALTKPWLFAEIKQARHWDISGSERLDIIREFVHDGLEHWGTDERGIATTRRFLLEWLSFTCRYIPVGLLEQTGASPCLTWATATAAATVDAPPLDLRGSCRIAAAPGARLTPRPNIAWRPPSQLRGRTELETLLASSSVQDWLEISVRAGLPPPPDDTLGFRPSHQSKAWRDS